MQAGGGSDHVFSHADDGHADGLMEGDEARDDGEDERHDQQPAQHVLQGEEHALLLDDGVEAVRGQAHGFVDAV